MTSLTNQVLVCIIDDILESLEHGSGLWTWKRWTIEWNFGPKYRSMVQHFIVQPGQAVAVSCGYDTWFAVRLVMDYTTSHFAWSIFGIPLDPTRSSQPEPDTQVSRCLWFPPYPAYGYTWVVLWLLFCRSAPFTFPATRSTFKGPFRGVPSR